ncbi:hypothetical protein [Pedosphaera parvula]|nr:hypothetical protein [Pedosphaera parvula]
MPNFNTTILTLLVCSLLSFNIHAQDTGTNTPKTRIEAFDTQIGVIRIKATSDMGTIPGKIGSVLIQCKESTDPVANKKEYGLAIKVSLSEQQQDSTTIDYDEIEPLIGAIDYISKIDYSVTTLPTFAATFTTRGDFTIATYTSKRQGNIQATAQSNRLLKTRVFLSMDQLAQLRTVLASAKNTIDSIRPTK